MSGKTLSYGLAVLILGVWMLAEINTAAILLGAAHHDAYCKDHGAMAVAASK